MNITSTIQSLYAIMCAAEKVCDDPNKDTSNLSQCLNGVSDSDVEQALTDLQYLLKELFNVNDNLKKMYMFHYKTGTDKDNKNILLQMECVFGAKIVSFTTMLDTKAAQSMVEALNMSLAMVKAGPRLSEEGRA